MLKVKNRVQRMSRQYLALVTIMALAISIACATSATPAFADNTWTPQISVFLADGTTPYNGQILKQEDKVIVKGSGFDPTSNVGGHGVPIPNTLSQGVYVTFGSFLDNWKPSQSAPSAARKTFDQKWVLSQSVLDQVPAQYKSTIQAGWSELKDDGTFRSEIKITDLDHGLQGGNWGIYTYPASGVINPAQELSVPLNVQQGDDTTPDITKPKVSISPTSINPKIENTFSITGTNFVGPGATSGVYILLGKTDLWHGQGALPPEGWDTAPNWVRPDDIHDGSFSTTLTVPANNLDITKSYQIVTSAAHGLSATDRSLDTFTPISLVEVLSGGPVVAPTTQATDTTQNEIVNNALNQEEECTARTINGATLSWGIKQSFSAYIQSSVAKGKITTSGVSNTNSIFGFSGGSGSYNDKESMGEILLPGSVHFEGHEGVLSVTISNVRIRVNNSTTGTIYVDYVASDMSGKSTTHKNVAFASIGFTSSIQNNVLILSGTKTTLLADGVDSFAGIYKAGESMDLINLRAPLGGVTVCGISTSRTLANTGSDSVTISLIATLFILLGGALLLLNKAKRKTLNIDRRILKKIPSIVATGLVGVLLVSCSASSTKQDTKKTSSNKDSTSKLSDPRTITGPSTAISVSDVKPITDSPKINLPATFTDERGKKVVVTNIDRIIALDTYGTLTQTVIGLGLQDHLVGRGQTSTSDSLKDLPVVTQNGIVLNAEAILALKPTVVLVDSSLGPPTVPDQLEASGVSVVHLSDKRDLESVTTRIQNVADALGVSDAGKALTTRVTDELVKAKKEIADLVPSEKMRMAFIYLRGSGGYFFVFGPGEGSDDLIKALGGIDVAGKIGIKGASPAKAETLITMDPEVILTMSDGLNSSGGIDELLKRPGVGQTTAGRNSRIVDMSDGQILAFGPNVGEVLVSLAHAIYDPIKK